MRKLAVCLTKGGVGKTTAAVNLSAGLAMSGFKVLLVDTDTQGQAGFMLGLKPEAGLAELMTGKLDPEEAIIEARRRLWLLAGDVSLAEVKRQMAYKEFGGEQTLTEILAPLDKKYDFVILDTSPGWDTMTINVLFYTQKVLVPVSLEVLTLKGLAEFSKRVEVIRKYRDLSLDYILPTFLDHRVSKSEEILAQLQAYYASQLCSPIRYNVRLSEAAGYGQTIYEYAPGSAGAEDFLRLTTRIGRNGKA